MMASTLFSLVGSTAFRVMMPIDFAIQPGLGKVIFSIEFTGLLLLRMDDCFLISCSAVLTFSDLIIDDPSEINVSVQSSMRKKRFFSHKNAKFLILAPIGYFDRVQTDRRYH